MANQVGNTIRKFSPTGHDLCDFVVVSSPLYLVITVPTFAGTREADNCHGQSVSTLLQQFRGLDAAASSLSFPDVQSLQNAIRAFCER